MYLRIIYVLQLIYKSWRIISKTKWTNILSFEIVHFVLVCKINNGRDFFFRKTILLHCAYLQFRPQKKVSTSSSFRKRPEKIRRYEIALSWNFHRNNASTPFTCVKECSTSFLKLNSKIQTFDIPFFLPLDYSRGTILRTNLTLNSVLID